MATGRHVGFLTAHFMPGAYKYQRESQYSNSYNAGINESLKGRIIKKQERTSVETGIRRNAI